MSNDSYLDGQSSTKKPKKKSFKETSKRLRDGKEHHLSHRSSLDWRLDNSKVCDKVDFTPKHLDINKIKDIISLSRTGEALLSKENMKNVEIHYDSQISLSQLYNRNGTFIITINPDRPKGDLINMLVRELRHVWQDKNDVLANPMDFEPDSAILLNRAQQADIFMLSIKVAWELKLQGEMEAWEFTLSSTHSDILRAFEKVAQEDFRTLNNGEASREAYNKFFEDTHTKTHDKRIIHQMLLDDKGYMKAGEKEHTIFMGLFHKLGELPHSSNYLSSSIGKDLPMDARYSGVEDRSNANFLWFIKFERSFQEKETQILQESVKKTAEIVDFAKTLRSRRGENPSLYS